MTRPPRILILNHNIRERGTYFRAWKVAKMLSLRGWDVTFSTLGHGWYRPRRDTIEGITVWDTPSWTPRFLETEGYAPLSILFRMVLAVGKPWDYVYTFSHRPVDQFPARVARLLRGATWICDWCDLYGGNGINAMQASGRKSHPSATDGLRATVDRWDEQWEIHAARSCQLLTVISTFLRDRAIALGTAPERIHLMISGADTERIKPQDQAECRRLYNLPTDKVILGYIANYHPDELLLLEALKIVFEQRPNTMLLAAGPGFYGGDAALAERGIADRIKHVGRLPFAQISTLMGAADMMLVPMTDSEFNRSRWPNKIGDHLAAARPQVAPAVGDVATFLQTHAVGLATKPTAADFARAIIELIDDPSRRQEMGREALRVAETAFSWESIVNELEKKIVASRR